MPITAILFDLDGTLVDSNEFHVEVWQKIFARHGHEIGVEAIRGQIGKGGDLLIPALLPATGEATRKPMSALHGEIFGTEYLRRVQPFAGAHDLSSHVHAAGQRIVLASSAKQAELDHYVELLDDVAALLAGYAESPLANQEAAAERSR